MGKENEDLKSTPQVQYGTILVLQERTIQQDTKRRLGDDVCCSILHGFRELERSEDMPKVASVCLVTWKTERLQIWPLTVRCLARVQVLDTRIGRGYMNGNIASDQWLSCVFNGGLRAVLSKGIATFHCNREKVFRTSGYLDNQRNCRQ